MAEFCRRILDAKHVISPYTDRCEYFNECPTIRILRRLSDEIGEDLVSVQTDIACDNYAQTECPQKKEFWEREWERRNAEERGITTGITIGLDQRKPRKPQTLAEYALLFQDVNNIRGN